jgi:hypothetical protein
MNEILEKLKGVLTEEDLTRLQNTLQRMVLESVNEKTEKAKAELAVLQEEFVNKEVARLLEEKLATEKTIIEESYKQKYDTLESDVLSKLSLFLESEVATKISDSTISKIAMNEIYEPLVNNLLKVFEENYVAIDTEGYKIMSEAKEEIERLEDEHSKTVTEKMSLLKENKILQTKLLIESKTYGLNAEQKDKVKIMFESKEPVDVEKSIDKYVEVLIESEISGKGNDKNSEKTVLAEGVNEELDPEKELREEAPTVTSRASKLL